MDDSGCETSGRVKFTFEFEMMDLSDFDLYVSDLLRLLLRDLDLDRDRDLDMLRLRLRLRLRDLDLLSLPDYRF